MDLKTRISENLTQVSVILAAILGYAGGWLVPNPEDVPDGVMPPVITFFILVVLLATIIPQFIEPTIVRYTRRNNKLERYDVNGYWLLKTFASQDKTDVNSLAIIKFAFAGYDMVVTGDFYDTDLNRLGSFRSSTLEYLPLRMRFTYEGIHKDPDSLALIGHGEFVFTEGISQPRVFNGFLQDNLNFEKRVFMQGERIIDQNWLRIIDDSETRKRLLMDYYKEKFSNSNIEMMNLEKKKEPIPVTRVSPEEY